MKKNLAVLISGQGTNLEVILRAKEKWNSVFVVSSNPSAFGLTRAKNHNVSTKILSQPVDWSDLQESLSDRKIDRIFCAGFMKIIPKEFIEKWEGRLFNLHPSLLPKYKGLKAIERAFEAGDEIGVSIHHIVPEVDAGEVIFQERALAPTDYENLSLLEVFERVQAKEHELVARWVDWAL